MKKEDDSLLVGKIQSNNDESALQELISRHSGIYIDMVRRYGANSLTCNQIADIMSDKDYQIYKAALEYDKTKCKFSTYLALKTKYLCLTGRVNNKKNENILNFDDIEYSQQCSGNSPSEEFEFNESLKQVIRLIDNHHDERVKKIFKERYFSSLNGKLKPWKEISKTVDLSIQGCINVHDRALEEFQKKISHGKINL